MTSSSQQHGTPVPTAVGLPAEALSAACTAGNAIARRLEKNQKVRSCPLRCEFIATDHPSAISPPMMFMLRGGTGERGGCGGALRLKLYLSMLWFGSGPPHDVTHPAYSWARLLGLRDPDGAGKRRVLDAIDWLDANRFVSRTRHPGRASTIRLLTESGTGDAYTKPLAVTGGRPSYRQLDADWWRNGWLATLSGPAIVVWLAYLDASGKKQGTPQWIAPSRTTDHYGMSPDTRQNGLRELQQWGLIERRRSRRREPFVTDRPITTYTIEQSRLRTRPDDWIGYAVAQLAKRGKFTLDPLDLRSHRRQPSTSP